MSDPLDYCRDILVADAPTVALVADRVEYIIKPQDLTIPCLALQTVSTAPVNGLVAFAGLDGSIVQVDCYAATYTDALALAAVARAALEAAGVLCAAQFTNYDPDIEQHRITLQFNVWL